MLLMKRRGISIRPLAAGWIRPLTAATIAAAVVVATGCARRETRPAPPPVATAAVEKADVAVRPTPSRSPKAPVIWLGLDGLDPDWMERLSADGKVPNWSRLVAEGASVKLASFMPILSPVVWTTEATGVGPDIHRVLDFQEVDPQSGEKVPVSGRSRAVAAVWNVASAAHLRVGVVGWWATHPAEAVDGFFVSDRACPISFPAGRSGTAYPPALDGAVAAVAARDGKIEARDLAGYLALPEGEIASRLASAEGMKDPVFALGRILASTRVNQRLARDLYDRERPDFFSVYFEGTDAIGHVFASDAPPRLPCVPEGDAARFGNAAIVYYEAIDSILGQWMRRAREDGATLLVTSDHGFKWGADRPCERSSSEWSTAAFWHRPDGVLAAWGARVAPGRDRAHPSVFDVAPTVFALLGLPPDPRMTGRPARALFSDLPELRPRPSLGTTPVARVAAAAATPAEASENARKLVALGYLTPQDAAATRLAPPGGSTPALTEGAYNNLGLYERETRGDLAAAEKDFRRALELRPGYHSPLFNLAILYRRQRKDALARDFLFRALAAGHADPIGTILAWAGEYRGEKQPGPEIELLRRGASVYPDNEAIARALGDAFFQRHDCRAADAALARFGDAAREPETLNGLALYETCLGNRERAVALFHRSLEIRPGQSGVMQALDVLGRAPRR